MRKGVYDENKSKKAILIIVIILIICFVIRFLMNIINSKEVPEIREESAAPVIQLETADELSEELQTHMRDNTEGVKEVSEMVLDIESEFYISEISDELFERMKGKSFKDDCTLDRSELRYVHVLHKNLGGETLEGELVVNHHIAKETLKIFKELYEADYPIEKIRLIDEYDADDEKSMADNNSSAFNFRFISNTNKISNHGYGLAIDINPLYNPYITTVNREQHVEPANAIEYVDRDGDFDYKITKDDLAYIVFTQYGFSWGGEWKNSKDYQHFEIPSEKIKEWYPN